MLNEFHYEICSFFPSFPIFWPSVVNGLAVSFYAPQIGECPSRILEVIIPPPTVVAGGIIFYC